MATSIVLFADDLTGALDSAIPFTTRGQSVRVALGVANIATAAERAPDVLVIDLDSRALPSGDAAARIDLAWRELGMTAPPVVMKKVDSRLKGEIAAETGALLAASGRAQAVICPAVLDQDRIVRRGFVQGAGIDAPIDIASRFTGIHAAIPDAASIAELDQVAATILEAPDRRLAVGARGLAAALARRIGADATADSPSPKLPMIIAVGSRDPITTAQVQCLCASGICSVVAAPDGRVPANPLPAADILLIHATSGVGEGDAAIIASRFGDGIAAHARTSGTRTIFATGGDTSAAIVRALGGGVLIPQHEIAPGVPLSRIEGVTDIDLITKSGGFGAPDTLVTIARDALAARPSVVA